MCISSHIIFLKFVFLCFNCNLLMYLGERECPHCKTVHSTADINRQQKLHLKSREKGMMWGFIVFTPLVVIILIIFALLEPNDSSDLHNNQALETIGYWMISCAISVTFLMIVSGAFSMNSTLRLLKSSDFNWWINTEPAVEMSSGKMTSSFIPLNQSDSKSIGQSLL